MPGVFPPLAASDFLTKQRERSLKAPLEGLTGKIEVNGQSYFGAMPPVLLDDEALAAVFAHVFRSWGNTGAAPTAAEIAAVRTRTKYPTLAALQAALGGGALPAAPAGWRLSVAAELSFSPVRLGAHPDGAHTLILAQNGDVWSWRSGTTEFARIIAGDSYDDATLGSASVMGFTVG